MNALAIGTTVRILSGTYEGKIGTITDADDSSYPYWVTGFSVVNPDMGRWLRDIDIAVVTDGETLTVSDTVSQTEIIRGGITIPANVTYDELLAIIEVTGNDLSEKNLQYGSATERAERAEQRLTEQQNRYANDMGHWEAVMREAKDDQNWCDEGTNSVIDKLNDGFIGGWTIDPYVSVVERRVTVRGTTTTTITVYVKDGDDAEDPDCWVDEDGYGIDSDEVMQEGLVEEFRRCSSQFDEVRVA